jgi:diguanylate cyclase (GGDEF)-like protein
VTADIANGKRIAALAELFAAQVGTREPDALARAAAEAVPRLAPTADAGLVALIARDGTVSLTASAGFAVPAWERTGHLPGRDVLVTGRAWFPDSNAAAFLRGRGEPVPTLGMPLRAEALRGVLYAFRPDAQGADEELRTIATALASTLSIALERADLHEEVSRGDRRLARMLTITADIARRRDFSAIAQDIVDGLTAVTDFQVAAITLRDGDVCRRLAASGLPSPKIGLETPYASWRTLLRAEWQIGELCYLIPPEAPAHWSEVVDPELEPIDAPDAWTPKHGLLVCLRDSAGETAAFLSVDQPRTRRLPDHRTVESLELFARQVQVALENARLYSELRRAAERDSLTGLQNRRMCWADLAVTVPEATPAQPVAVAVLDIDNFKAVNDAHGHRVGDRVLCHVADRLHRSIRETDRLYRVGGDEFVVVLPGAGLTEAVAVLERTLAAVRRSRAKLPGVTLSAGVAEAPRDGGDADAIFRAADDALYAVKGTGRNRVVSARTG